jgi:hypothetical protein
MRQANAQVSEKKSLNGNDARQREGLLLSRLAHDFILVGSTR